MAKQSRLEKEAISFRNDTLILNDYMKDNNEYSENHDDAKWTGDEKGKGVGVSATPYLIPDERGSKTSFTPTLMTSDGGNLTDHNTRKALEIINLYGKDNQYGENSVDTSANVAQGQYVVR